MNSRKWKKDEQVIVESGINAQIVQLKERGIIFGFWDNKLIKCTYIFFFFFFKSLPRKKKILNQIRCHIYQIRFQLKKIHHTKSLVLTGVCHFAPKHAPNFKAVFDIFLFFSLFLVLFGFFFISLWFVIFLFSPSFFCLFLFYFMFFYFF